MECSRGKRCLLEQAWGVSGRNFYLGNKNPRIFYTLSDLIGHQKNRMLIRFFIPIFKKEDLQNRWGREVGYVLSKDYWGKGLIPEAVKRVIQYAFDEEGWDFLLCGHFLENRQSRRVIEKSGFHYYRDIVFPTRWGEDKPGKLYLLERKK